MIRKIIYNFILLLFFILIIFLMTLSTIGIETNKFNRLISEKIEQDKNINLELKTINFKLDPRELSLFLETKKPKINYRNLFIPTQNIKVYIDFLPLFKTNLKIKKIILTPDELDVIQLNNLSKFIKPSNFKRFLNNKILDGKLMSEIEIFLNDEGQVEDYIIKGQIKNLKANIFDSLNFSKINLSFFADKEDILIKNIFGNIESTKISDGDIKLKFDKGVKLSSNFITDFKFDDNFLKKHFNFLDKFGFVDKVIFLKGKFNNNATIDLDNTYKLTNYNYNFSGKLEKGRIRNFFPSAKNYLLKEIEEIYLKDVQIDTNFSTKNIKLLSNGKYSLNNLDFLKFDIENNSINETLRLIVNLDFKNSFDLSLINYKKKDDSIANLSFLLNKEKNLINIEKLNFTENKNFIKLKDLQFIDNNFLALKRIDIKNRNNDFFIQWGKKILIKGNKFDASNLIKSINRNNDKINFDNINQDIEIDFKNIKVPLSESLENFRLIGQIKKGKFIKISSKGDFGGNNYLDISLKKDKKTDKKFLEIYSDLPRPLLTEYNFFNGLSGGTLNFTSLIDGSKSNSKLKIENFKVVNAPGMVKLLSLADLGGLADLAEGEGLSFDLLEIHLEKNKNFLKINEILALGPSLSVLMEGYQDEKGLTSLRGTLVPAKTLNKIISKIPVIGNIVIPKEVGEGLFGISFKMKGPKGKIKTTINPIRTLTPRFIQKIIDKSKN